MPADPAADRIRSVLVVDDERMIVRALERLLVRHGYEVTTASDAHGALRLIEERTFDAVLVDHNMPGGGASVVEALRVRSGFSGRVVLMTGDSVDDPRLAFGPRVTLLQKPFDFDRVLELLGR